MFVCHCKVVRDGEIREAIACGATDEGAVAEVCRGAGTGCGGCRPAIRRLLAEETTTTAAGEAAEPVGAGRAA